MRMSLIQQSVAAQRSAVARKLSWLTGMALMRGMLLSEERGCVYIIKANIAGHPLLMETLDIEAIEVVILSMDRVEDWNANTVRRTLASYRLAKERTRNEAKDKRSN